MSPLVLLTLCAVLGNNLALTQLLGAPPSIDLARKLALVTGCVLIPAALSAWLIDHFLLMPFALVWLDTFVFSCSVAVLATVSALLLQRYAPVPPGLRNVLLPLLISNGIVSGVALNGAGKSLGSVLVTSVVTAGGFALLLMMLTALQHRLAASDVPAPFQGSSILLITGGVIALALMGLAGLV